MKVLDTVDTAFNDPSYHRELYAILALDVANTFNTTRWDKIKEALHEKRVPNYVIRAIQSYLSNREFQYSESGKMVT